MLDSRCLYILISFVFSNIFAIIVVLILPIKAQQEDLPFLIFLNLSFLIIVLTLSLVTLVIFIHSRPLISKSNEIYNKNYLRFIIYAPIIGLSLIIYERIFIRKISYLEGIRHARYQWLNSIGGNWESILGNILVSFSYVSLFYLIINFNRLNKSDSIKLFCSSLVLGGLSLLNGGRSTILLAICVFITAFLLRNSNHKKKYSYIVYSIFIIATILITSIITLSSLSLSNESLFKELLLKQIYYLKGEPSQDLVINEHSDIYYLIIYFLSYLYHAQWTTQTMSTNFTSYGSYLFYPFGILFNKISSGYIDIFSGGSFSDEGIFLSLPGAFYHDFGYIGLIILSALTGLITGISLAVLRNSTFIGGIKASLILANVILLILSPIVPAFGFAYIFHVIFAFLAVGVIFRNVNLIQ